jgi:hypothetical protein
MQLMEHQEEAIPKLASGKILWGGVGSGKSATVLAYYTQQQSPRDIIVITTAKKRDSGDWEAEAIQFGISTKRGMGLHGTIVVDSWNNIGNYLDRRDCFFVFDEQRVVGHGAWVKSFIKIARQNQWVLLSGTPGDSWLDYAPVFIANGFYKNITDFKMQHVKYKAFSKFPIIEYYLNTQKLEIIRNDVLVEMPFIRHTERILNYVPVGYDLDLFKRVYKDRWHIYEDRPLKDSAEMFRVLRKVMNSDPSRLELIREKLMPLHPRLIIWYNFNYELEILRGLRDVVETREWNGHVKDPLPQGDRWVYLVQYISGSEAWNCVTTDAMVFYSQTYSYKNFEQAQGRIDRLDTPYVSLYYYILISNSIVDRAIKQSLSKKQNFNERKFEAKLLDVDEYGDAIVEGCEI